MEGILLTGGCGFIGRNLTRRLLERIGQPLLIVDNLSSGKSPDNWLGLPLIRRNRVLKVYGKNENVLFLNQEIRQFLRQLSDHPKFLAEEYGIPISHFSRAYHLAAVVGGRSVIENDPMATAVNLSIDAEFFRWACEGAVERVLYPSSSAAYPIQLQQGFEERALKEEDIDLRQCIQPDLIYGWAKLTGENLARISAEKYDVSVACVRPFSGYGEDQDITYPIPAIARRFALKENPLAVWGDGEQKRDFIYIDDVLDAFELAIMNINDGSAVNISSGKATSFLEVISILQAISHHYPEIQKQVNKPVGVRCRYGDNQLSKIKIGWKAKTSLEEGLIKVYKQQKKLLLK